MPTIPKLAGPRVDPSAARLPFRRPATSNLSFGGGEARALMAKSRIASHEAFASGQEAAAKQRDANALQRAGDTFRALAQRERQRQSNLEVLRAKDKLGAFERGLEDDVYSQRGENAEGSTARTEQRMKALEQSILEESSPGTRAVLQEVVGNWRRSTLGHVSRHERKEREKIEQVLHKSNADDAGSRFLRAGIFDDGSINESHLEQLKNDIGMHVQAMGDLQGMPQEVIDREKRERLSGAVRGRIERLMADGESIKADKMLTVNGDLLTEEDEVALTEQVRKASVGQAAQDYVDALGRVSLGEGVAQARKDIKDEALRSKVIDKLKQRHVINEELRQNYERRLRRTAWEQAQNPNAPGLTAEQMRVLGGTGVAQWEKTRARVEAGLPLVDDSRKLSEWYDLTPSQRAAIDANTFWKDWAPHFDAGTVEQLDRDRRSAREAKSPSTPAVNGVITKSEASEAMVMRLLDKTVGTSKGKLSPAQQEQRALIRKRLDDEIVQWQLNNPGKKVDATSLPALIAKVERSYVHQADTFLGFRLPWSEDLVPVGDITPEDMDVVSVPIDRIPEGERSRVVKQFNDLTGTGLDENGIEAIVALRRVMASTQDRSVYDAALRQMQSYAKDQAGRDALQQAMSP